MLEYTGESLEKMLKRDLIPIALNLQSVIAKKKTNNDEILEEMRKFNDNFIQLHSKLVVTKRVNTKLTKRNVNIERGIEKMPSTLENNV